MAEDKVEQREFNLRQMLPWTELFRSFQVALDPKKLLLAAGGILTMALGWWLLAAIFGSSTKPEWDSPAYSDFTKFQHKDDANPAEDAKRRAWESFREDREEWNVTWRAAGNPDVWEYRDAGDLAADPAEYEALKEPINTVIKEMRANKETTRKVTLQGETYIVSLKPAGTLRTLPWYEDRGPNPYLMVTGQVGKPWETVQTARNQQPMTISEWFLTEQFPVLIEPLRKFLTPVVLLLNPKSGALNRFYFLLVILWTLTVWAFFGGAITRMASVQVARNEKVGMREAVRFVWSRYASFLSAPLFPLLFIAFMVVLLSVYGIFFMIPWLGDIVVAGVGWPLVLLSGVAMAVVLVGLVGWPMMYATISAEGSDSFDAISRSYSYVYQSPWNYAWYSGVALVYGAAVIFFVGFMGSMVVYMGKWAVGQTPFIATADREPSFLFVYAPQSFGWRTLMLQNAAVDGELVVKDGRIDDKPGGAYDRYVAKMKWWNKAGATLVSVWLYGFFLMILGFGYSFFWSASTIIYLLMRRKVDDTDMDEIYLEEDDEEPYPAPGAPQPAASATSGTQITTMLEPPALRTSTPPATSTAPLSTPPASPPVESENHERKEEAAAVSRTEAAPEGNGDGAEKPADKDNGAAS
ncbi:MAG: hypothetical protein JNM56_08770 [Planctomycetia bacterium]|nr:hypothetical protein [Planctomycetia bacterium]